MARACNHDVDLLRKHVLVDVGGMLSDTSVIITDKERRIVRE